ncbi:proton-associated sugar transporter A-like [Uranotaenia lowii]|uniref:proton-associated sugar transporter A-like n=1 Tax=Uranotaenia lowii TaxID=190385 RepID=UPI0024785561|nr:proton-associated sugar transporter A-like [Uranotaenia lowii]
MSDEMDPPVKRESSYQHHISDKVIMEHMLRERFEHAKKQEKDYSHLFRPKRAWELVRLALYQLSVEFCYAAETGFASPIILSNGLSHTFMTMIWAFSPVLGFLFAPVVAAFSDQIRLSWGRRRPVLIALALAVCTGLCILPHGKTLGILLGDDDVPVEEMSGFRWGIVLTTIGLVLTDFDIETSSGIGRAYYMDMCIIDDHPRVLTTAMIVGGIGGTAGYTLGAIDWSQNSFGTAMGSNEAAVFLCVVIVMLIGVLVTVTSYREVSLPQMEKDALLRPITQSMFEEEKKRQLAIYSVSGVVLEPRKSVDGYSITVDEKEEPSISCGNFFKNLIHMPKSLAILYLTQFLSMFGYLSYCMYFTDFVGSAVFEGDVTAPTGSPGLILYEEGVRFGCWGMAVFTGSCALYSLMIEKLIKYFSARYVYVGGILVYSIGMLLMAVFRTKWMVLACGPTVGIMYATIYSIPFLAISQYHAKNSFAIKDGKYAESNQKRGFGTDVSMLSSMLFLAQLILALGIGSVIDAIGDTTVIIYTASLFSFFAAISATQVLLMDL